MYFGKVLSMKALIVTVAGLSSRFSKSVGKETIKCIFTKKNYKSTLIYNLLSNFNSFDYYVIVGGYRFYELKLFIDKYLWKLKDKIILVNNEKYITYNSGYSLYVGIKALEGKQIDSIIFAEGDLFLDKESMDLIYNTDSNVITINNENIDSEKSVVLYINSEGHINYLYDLNHSLLEIAEPFKAIYNSGQVWKFNDITHLFFVIDNLSEIEKQGTNLIIVQNYFKHLSKDEYTIIKFNKWINCNTIHDYDKADI